MVPTAIRHPSEMSADTLQADRLIRAMPSECSWSSTTAGTYTRYDIPRVQETILMPGKVGAWVLNEDQLRRTLLPKLFGKSGCLTTYGSRRRPIGVERASIGRFLPPTKHTGEAFGYFPKSFSTHAAE